MGVYVLRRRTNSRREPDILRGVPSHCLLALHSPLGTLLHFFARSIFSYVVYNNHHVYPCKTAPTSAGKRKCMSPDELIEEINELEAVIAKLQSENKRLKASTTSSPGSAVVQVSPEKIAAKANKLKQGYRSSWNQITNEVEKVVEASWSGMCDEATFRAFMGFTNKDKTKGDKMRVGTFEDLLGVGYISASIWYGSLHLRGENVNITYKKDDQEIKITGSYGL